MVRELRKGKYHNGLVLANGGWLTYQYVVCLSSEPRRAPYPEQNPLRDLLDGETIPALEEKPQGEAIIEVGVFNIFGGATLTMQTYTVEFNRDGTPLRGHVVGRLKNDSRFLANQGDEGTLRELASGVKEQIGRSVWVRAGDEERNVFSFGRSERL